MRTSDTAPGSSPSGWRRCRVRLIATSLAIRRVPDEVSH